MDKIEELLKNRAAIDLQLEKMRTPVAVLFSDIRGSTAFFEAEGDVEGLAMVEQHNMVLFPVIKANSGRVVKTVGDAIMASFEKPENAIRAAIGMQQALEVRNRSRGRNQQIHIRIGIHTGLGLVKDGDIYGDVVNTASRVETHSEPDEIYISSALTPAATAAGVNLIPAGSAELKGKSETVELFKLDWRGCAQMLPALDETIKDTSAEPAAGAVAHYRLIKEIGHGSMGVIYEAKDTHLGRYVALKFLPKGLANTPEAMERLEREARAASALEDPHICTVHDIDHFNGQPYIVMELLRGRTLKEEIAAQQMPLREILRIATEISEGLEAAHEANIIHRDLKPANIFITNHGHAKILDFGLAKFTECDEDPDSSQLPTIPPNQDVSEAGSIIGTAAYMSPEQARGETLDNRTDLFSLGAVLFEMATQTRAFRGKTIAQIHHAILAEDPPPARQLNITLPARLERIIERLLKKDPNARYPSIGDVRRDLAELAEEVEKQIVLADSVTIPPIVERVTHRRWRFAVAGLVVLAVMLAVVFGTQSRRHPAAPPPGLAAAGTPDIPKSADPSATPPAPSAPSGPPDSYVKGRQLLNRATAEELNQAAKYFTAAISENADYAPAYAALAGTYARLAGYGLAPSSDFVSKAREAASKAITLDRNLAEAHAALGGLLFRYDRQPMKAEQEFTEAVRLAPNDASVHQAYGMYLIAQARDTEATAELEKARQLDPMSAPIIAATGLHSFYMRQYDLAIASLKEAVRMDAKLLPARLLLVESYAQNGAFDDATREIRAMEDSAQTKSILARIYAASGNRDEAQKILSDLLEKKNDRYVSPYYVGAVQAALGDAPGTVESLQKAVEEKSPWVVYLRIDPRFDALRSDESFKSLLDRL
jgi:serine/threonine protein kinase/class 3 adenylate cyclase/Tfp pilus assembly protein PilF